MGMKYFLLLIGIVLLVSGCTQGAPANGATSGSNAHRVITVSQLKIMMDSKDFILVNVHIPYEGEIEGTDLFVPYNEIEQNLSKLPADKDARIVVYCQSGNMSNIAAKRLTGLGYTNIRDVSGGMIAWEQAGYPLIQNPR